MLNIAATERTLSPAETRASAAVAAMAAIRIVGLPNQACA
jgi:hypothetical protein